MIILISIVIIGVGAELKLTGVDEPTGGTNLHNYIHREVETAPDVEDVVITEHGSVRGFKRNSGIWQYLDVPYGAFDAENPFQDPSPPKDWETTREITQHQSHCPQLLPSGTYSGSEDCLTLSIFTPQQPSNNDVLFHIHDGMFASGSGDPTIYGPEYLVPKGIILVLPNYRLGPLGFLCSLNSVAPGNAGLKDLVLALNWTRHNIAAFGGNASNIVISGSEAGAAIAEYLILSKQSKHLINKAITESGSMLSHWAFERQPLETEALYEENIQKIKDLSNNFIRNNFADISLELLVQASKSISFRPCRENSSYGFITENPGVMLQNTNLQISYMAGSTEQASMKSTLQHTEETISQLNTNYTLLLPGDLKFDSNEIMDKIGKQVKTQYFCNDDITLDTIEKLSLSYTDCSFLSPSIRAVRTLVGAGTNVFYYEFSYLGAKDVKNSMPGQSLNYVFSNTELFAEDTEEYKMMTTMTSLWVSFIKTGHPSLEDTEWPALNILDVDEEAWLSIGRDINLKKGFHRNRLELWDTIYKNHYFDRNSSVGLQPSMYYVFIVFIMNKSKSLITL